MITIKEFVLGKEYPAVVKVYKALMQGESCTLWHQLDRQAVVQDICYPLIGWVGAC